MFELQISILCLSFLRKEDTFQIWLKGYSERTFQCFILRGWWVFILSPCQRSCFISTYLIAYCFCIELTICCSQKGKVYFPVSIKFSHKRSTSSSWLFCCCCSPSRRILWPWCSVCTQTQTGRWTCTGPLSVPFQTAALAPSECISGCQYHSPDLEVREESIGWVWYELKENKMCILNVFFFLLSEYFKLTHSVNGLEDHINHHYCTCSTNSSTAQLKEETK